MITYKEYLNESFLKGFNLYTTDTKLRRHFKTLPPCFIAYPTKYALHPDYKGKTIFGVRTHLYSERSINFEASEFTYRDLMRVIQYLEPNAIERDKILEFVNNIKSTIPYEGNYYLNFLGAIYDEFEDLEFEIIVRDLSNSYIDIPAFIIFDNYYNVDFENLGIFK